MCNNDTRSITICVIGTDNGLSDVDFTDSNTIKGKS